MFDINHVVEREDIANKDTTTMSRAKASKKCRTQRLRR